MLRGHSPGRLLCCIAGNRSRKVQLTVTHAVTFYESTRADGKSGGGVMDKPVTTPNRESEFDLR
eukprot:1022778-Prorocentrum_minimum.AAC.5